MAAVSFYEVNPRSTTVKTNSKDETKWKWKYVIVGTFGVVALGLLAYVTLHKKKKPQKKPNKYIYQLKKKQKWPFIESINLCMGSLNGDNAHFYGSSTLIRLIQVNNVNVNVMNGDKLIQINNINVSNKTYKEILNLLYGKHAKYPITLTFRPSPDINKQWAQSQRLAKEAVDDQKDEKCNLDKCINKITAAIKLHPTNKELYAKRMKIYLKSNKFRSAMKDIEILATFWENLKHCETMEPYRFRQADKVLNFYRSLVFCGIHQYKKAEELHLQNNFTNNTFLGQKATNSLNECRHQIKRFGKLIEFQTHRIEIKKWSNYDLLMIGYFKLYETEFNIFIPDIVKNICLQYYYQTPQFEKQKMKQINFKINRSRNRNINLYKNGISQNFLNEWILFTNYDNFFGEFDENKLQLRNVMRPDGIDNSDLDESNNSKTYFLTDQEWNMFKDWYGVSERQFKSLPRQFSDIDYINEQMPD